MKHLTINIDHKITYIMYDDETIIGKGTINLDEDNLNLPEQLNRLNNELAYLYVKLNPKMVTIGEIRNKDHKYTEEELIYLSRLSGVCINSAFTVFQNRIIVE